MITMDGKEQQTMGATHSQLYRELLATQNKLAEQVEWVKHAFGEDRKALAAALARYEAAEAEVAQWRGFVTAIQERLQVALARVAELEAQLAYGDNEG